MMTDTRPARRRPARRTDEEAADERLHDALTDLVTFARCDDVEESILGAVLLNWRRVWPSVDGRVFVGDFADTKRAAVFEAILAVVARKGDVDLATVASELGARVEAIGGAQYLAELREACGTVAHIDSWVRALSETAAKRRGQQVMVDALTAAQTRPFEEFLGIASTLHEALEGRTVANDLAPVDEIMLDVFERIQTTAATGKVGRTTGLRDLDAVTGGYTGGQLIVIAARPAMGKTSLVIETAAKATIEAKANGEEGAFLFFSLEMPKTEIVQRMTASRARVSESVIRRSKLNEEHMKALAKEANVVAALPILVADAMVYVEDIVSACRQARLKYGRVIGVAIDYLQLMRWRGAQKNTSPEQVVSEISRALKGLAKELDCAIQVLSQLNRDCEKRPNKRPMLADLRQSGAIEQDADAVLFIYREEVYKRDTEDKGIAELILGKQRHGPTGIVRTRFFKEFTHFEDMPHPADGLRDFDGYGGASGDPGTESAEGDDSMPPWNPEG